MPYDETLADRVCHCLAELPGTEEKRLMGGLCFMVAGKMALGIMKDELVVRVDPAGFADLLERPGARAMDMHTRPMVGYILVDPATLRTAKELKAWIDIALEFNPRAKAGKK